MLCAIVLVTCRCLKLSSCHQPWPTPFLHRTGQLLHQECYFQLQPSKVKKILFTFLYWILNHVDGASMECQPRCWWNVNGVSIQCQLRVSVDIWPGMPYIHMIQIFRWLLTYRWKPVLNNFDYLLSCVRCKVQQFWFTLWFKKYKLL